MRDRKWRLASNWRCQKRGDPHWQAENLGRHLRHRQIKRENFWLKNENADDEEFRIEKRKNSEAFGRRHRQMEEEIGFKMERPMRGDPHWNAEDLRKI